MQRLEVSGAVRPIYGSLGVKQLRPTFGAEVESRRPQPKLSQVFWEAIPLCIIKFAQYIMYRQYTKYIKTSCNNYN